MSSRERTTKEKMIEFMEDSAFEVAAWPEWKRNTLFTGERGPLPTNPAAINRRLKLLEEQKLSIEKEMDKLNKMLKEKA